MMIMTYKEAIKWQFVNVNSFKFIHFIILLNNIFTHIHNSYLYTYNINTYTIHIFLISRYPFIYITGILLIIIYYVEKKIYYLIQKKLKNWR